MTSKRVFLSSPHLSGLEEQFVADAFATNWVTLLGPHVDAFEVESAAAVGARYAVASELGHGGVAPRVVACRRRAWRRGARVSTLTFVASVNPIVYLGATPMGTDTVSGATATEATVFGEPDEASVTPLPQLGAADVTNTTNRRRSLDLGCVTRT